MSNMHVNLIVSAFSNGRMGILQSLFWNCCLTQDVGDGMKSKDRGVASKVSVSDQHCAGFYSPVTSWCAKT